MKSPNGKSPLSDPATGLHEDGDMVTSVRLSSDKAWKVWKTCLKAVTPFSGVAKGMVPEPQEKWKTLTSVFRALLKAPRTRPEENGPLMEQLLVTITEPPLTIDRTLRLVLTVPGGHPKTISLSSFSDTELGRVQLSEWEKNLIINRETRGWNVTLFNARETRLYRIDPQGNALETGSGAFGKEKDQDLLDYQANRDTDLKRELEDYRKTATENREFLKDSASVSATAQDLEAAFSDIDGAEQKRQEDLRKRREELERKTLEAKTPPSPSKETEPAVSSSPDRREDRAETGVSETPKLCAHCGEALIEGKAFCASCGRPVPEEPEPPASEPEPEPLAPGTCTHCGAELPLGKSFCPDCGTPTSRPEQEKEAAAPPEPIQTAPPPPESPAEEPMTIPAEEVCPHCHAALKPHAKFCTACGADLTSEPTPEKGVAPPPPVSPLKPPSDACPHCGKDLKPGAKFCTGCGGSVSGGTPPASAHTPGPEALPQCPGCSAPLKANARFCTQCGHTIGHGAQPQAPPPPAAKAAAPQKGKKEKQPGQKRMGPGMMDTAMTFAPGLILDFTRRWPLYQQDPRMAMTMILPCVMSFLSVGLAPRLGKWFAIVLILISLGWLVYPMFMGGGLGDHAGRGLVGGSFIYTIMRLIRTVRR